MAHEFPSRGSLNLPEVMRDVQAQWDAEDVFRRSVSERPKENSFVFYEGPPSANGQPGIHHVMGRAIKDIFCRFQTLQGKRVERKAGWDTHGLPVELSVEKELGITKEDIGTKLSVEDYNAACRKTVMRYTDRWNALTREMGYWVDMESPYITYESKYIESVWWLLAQLYKRDYIYKGYTIQPFSPKAGTGLSTHELNQPGAYQDVTDTTVIAQFRLVGTSAERLLGLDGVATGVTDSGLKGPVDLLAWTTTPWTLPSNTALTVGAKIDYVVVATCNRYTEEAGLVVLAEALYSKQFEGKKAPQGEIIGRVKGADLVGLRYEQLIDWAQPMGSPEAPADAAFQVIAGDFVTTEDGTGIVHTAPTFGADDARVAAAAGVPPMLVADDVAGAAASGSSAGSGGGVPLVDRRGRFIGCCGPMAGRYVRNEYYDEGQAPDRSVDVEIAIELKTRGRAFKVEKYTHSYPHCWRTDKPILYYPMDSWFVRATAAKERMMELNKTILWKPASTGTGRFGKWLENLNDWNLSRSRFWGIPIPIWRTEDGDEAVCIESVEQLKAACDEAVQAGVMAQNPLADFAPGDMSAENYEGIDLHKHRMDNIVLVSSDGRPMKREADLIDVWFDSGSMPYAQGHYPFESPERIDQGTAFPADFIAEGVDQTRGWFYTLHAIAAMVFDSVAYKSVVSNGLVLDKHGVKMSKRLGNTVDPFETIGKYGADATRWYMVTNAQPWDNLRFDVEGIAEVQRKFFGTLHNTYAFFAMYAQIDEFQPHGDKGNSGSISVADRPEIDRWILSRLQTTLAEVQAAYSTYEPTKAGRTVQRFVVEELSNWYVRQSRRRFWKSENASDKLSAYQTLHRCLSEVAIMASPIAPFFADRLHRDLGGADSVHLALWPKARPEEVDVALESRMALAQQMCSMALALRKKENIRVRQPLRRILVPVLTEQQRLEIEAICELVCAEINVKGIEMLEPGSGVISKRLKADFKKLGPRYGKQMKALAAAIGALDNEAIIALEQDGAMDLDLGEITATISLDDVEILTDDIPGWTVMTEGAMTVALDIEVDPELRSEGLARELVNRVQNLRKERGLEVTDRIVLTLDGPEDFQRTVAQNLDYIRAETLADEVRWELALNTQAEGVQVEELEPTLSVSIAVEQSN
jgi:isoleucyl-tRNA synthetase